MDPSLPPSPLGIPHASILLCQCPQLPQTRSPHRCLGLGVMGAVGGLSWCCWSPYPQHPSQHIRDASDAQSSAVISSAFPTPVPGSACPGPTYGPLPKSCCVFPQSILNPCSALAPFSLVLHCPGHSEQLLPPTCTVMHPELPQFLLPGATPGFQT